MANEDIFHLGIKALIRNSEGKILLLHVNQEILKVKMEDLWDIPGGRIQKDSTLEETLKREVFEELGVNEISNIQEVTFVLSPKRIPLNKDNTENVGLILGVFSCEIPADSEIILSEEHTEYAWFEPKDAAELLKVKYPESFTSKIQQL